MYELNGPNFTDPGPSAVCTYNGPATATVHAYNGPAATTHFSNAVATNVNSINGCSYIGCCDDNGQVPTPSLVPYRRNVLMLLCG